MIPSVVIIAIGTEMTQGNGLDTNGPWLARHLGRLGLRVRTLHVVSDDRLELYEELAEEWRKGNSVITIGGLGPTEDDRTRDVIAAVLGEKLKKNKAARSDLSARYGATKLSDSAKRQTRLPKSATMLPNAVGVAPGFAVQHKLRFLAALPGPPREFKAVVEDGLLPVLRQWYELGAERKAHELTVFGISEPDTNERLKDLLEENSEVHASILTAQGKVLLRWQGLSDRGEVLAQEQHAQARERLGRRVVLNRATTGDWSAQSERVVELLKEHGLKLALAESCTGGQVAELITQIPGASEVFDLAVVSYSNAMKQRILGVNTETLVKHGAVSRECVRAMASGVMEAADAGIAVAISGIAGPDGGTPERPRGLVWFGLCYRNQAGEVAWAEYPCEFRGGRQRVQQYAALNALDIVRLTLESDGHPRGRDVAYFARAFR